MRSVPLCTTHTPCAEGFKFKECASTALGALGFHAYRSLKVIATVWKYDAIGASFDLLCTALMSHD